MKDKYKGNDFDFKIIDGEFETAEAHANAFMLGILPHNSSKKNFFASLFAQLR